MKTIDQMLSEALDEQEPEQESEQPEDSEEQQQFSLGIWLDPDRHPHKFRNSNHDEFAKTKMGSSSDRLIKRGWSQVGVDSRDIIIVTKNLQHMKAVVELAEQLSKSIIRFTYQSRSGDKTIDIIKKGNTWMTSRGESLKSVLATLSKGD